jgi:hypothetical protein
MIEVRCSIAEAPGQTAVRERLGLGRDAIGTNQVQSSLTQGKSQGSFEKRARQGKNTIKTIG